MHVPHVFFVVLSFKSASYCNIQMIGRVYDVNIFILMKLHVYPVLLCDQASRLFQPSCYDFQSKNK